MKNLFISTWALFVSIQLIVGWVGLLFQQFGKEYEYHAWMLIMLLIGCVFLVISLKYMFKWLNDIPNKNMFVYYSKLTNDHGGDDVAITEQSTKEEAIKHFKKYYNNVSDENVKIVDVNRKGYTKNMHIISDY